MDHKDIKPGRTYIVKRDSKQFPAILICIEYLTKKQYGRDMTRYVCRSIRCNTMFALTDSDKFIKEIT